MKDRIKAILRTNILTKNLYSKLYSIKLEKEKRKKRKILHDNGVATIHLIQKILEDKYFFFFDMGTLLGIVREGNLLGHDIDIDTAIFLKDESEVEQFRSYMKQNGCVLKYSYILENNCVVEDSYLLNGIKFDVNYYRRGENKDKCYLMYIDPSKTYGKNQLSVVELSCSHIRDTEKMDFFGEEINVPEKAQEYLAQRYGEKWTVPDKNYIYWKGPSTKPIDIMGYQIKYEEESK